MMNTPQDTLKLTNSDSGMGRKGKVTWGSGAHITKTKGTVKELRSWTLVLAVNLKASTCTCMHKMSPQPAHDAPEKGLNCLHC